MVYPGAATNPTPPPDASPAFARRLAADSIANHDDTGWFETLYAAANQVTTTVPWTDFAPSRRLVSALAGLPGGGRAIVIGCGLGDDAEHTASLGYATVAIDVSPTAIARARRRFLHPTVEYMTADLLSPPPLTAAEIGSFQEQGLVEDSVAEVIDNEDGRLIRRWQAWFTAPRSGDR